MASDPVSRHDVCHFASLRVMCISTRSASRSAHDDTKRVEGYVRPPCVCRVPPQCGKLSSTLWVARPCKAVGWEKAVRALSGRTGAQYVNTLCTTPQHDTPVTLRFLDMVSDTRACTAQRVSPESPSRVVCRKRLRNKSCCAKFRDGFPTLLHVVARRRP